MARILLNTTTYTQVNTIDSAYLAQNISNMPIEIVISATAPLDNTPYDVYLKPLDVITNNDVVGILWAKGRDVEISVIE